jgi:hypothetical protein
MRNRTLSDDTVMGLSSGIRSLVVWLDRQGFNTTDSGDGSNHAAGMEGAMPCPMVAITTEPHRLVADAQLLFRMLREQGVDFNHACRGMTCDPPEEANWPQIQASFDPADGSGIILLTNVLSKDVRECRKMDRIREKTHKDLIGMIQ